MFLMNKKPFPIRTFFEMYTEEAFIIKITQDLKDRMLYFWEEKDKDILKIILKNIYARYADRYPIEQDNKKFIDYFLITFSQFYTTFINRLWNFFYQKKQGQTFKSNADLLLDGAESETISENGTSTSPYNLNYSALSPDFLSKQQFSEKQSDISKSKNKSSVLNTMIRMGGIRITGEIEMFVNSFYKLFSQLNLDDFVDNQLSFYIESKKEKINFLIDAYNKLIKQMDKLKITKK